jgi:hypothetical protein
MRILSLVAASALLALPSCTQFEVTAQAGFAQLALDGHFGYVDGSTTANIDQDVESAFGLGDDQGSPVVRAGLDMGLVHVLASGLMFEDEGTGTLQANFGNNLTAGTVVQSEFDFNCAKIALVFDIPIGPVTIAPGFGVDYVDLMVNVRDTFGVAVEEADLTAPIPLLFLRGDVDFSIFNAALEIGYSAVDTSDIDAKLLDVEAMLEVEALGWLNFFAGYRLIQFEADGLIDDDTYDIDLGLSGSMLGGGVRF